MKKTQNKNNNLSGKLERLLRPIYQIHKIDMNFVFEYDHKEYEIIVIKDYKKRDFYISLKTDKFKIEIEHEKLWYTTYQKFLYEIKRIEKKKQDEINKWKLMKKGGENE